MFLKARVFYSILFYGSRMVLSPKEDWIMKKGQKNKYNKKSRAVIWMIISIFKSQNKQVAPFIVQNNRKQKLGSLFYTSIKYMKKPSITKKLLFIFPLVYIMLALNGCVASSNFYTARTLQESKFSLGFGVDDIVTKSTDNSITVSKNVIVVPSISMAYGLPWRLEAGLRYYPTRFFEGMMRWQVNPRSFDILDCSLNFSYASLIDGYSYLKYGISISKNIQEFEPYVHYSSYRYMGATKEAFSDNFTSSVTDDFINNNHSIGFGIALPIRHAKLYPEANYQYFGKSLNGGLWHFGIGIRINVN
jgi:hypothetical protein